MFSYASVLAFLCVVAVLIERSMAIDCYQCFGTDSDNPFQCNEYLGRDNDLQPSSCDAVFGAKYCVKHIGRFEAWALKCFQCSAGTSIDCSDGMIHMGGIEPEECSSVFEAQYCIKSTALHGGIGAKRFCSSHDLGNYCNMVSQPGDKLTYRSCIFTCSGDGCNGAESITSTSLFSAIAASLMIFVL